MRQKCDVPARMVMQSEQKSVPKGNAKDAVDAIVAMHLVEVVHVFTKNKPKAR